MPLVDGDKGDKGERSVREAPHGRIRNTRKLLISAAAIMSVLLLLSSFVAVLLIPEHAYRPGGPANGRAVAYLAHELIGNGFGSLYDLSSSGVVAGGCVGDDWTAEPDPALSAAFWHGADVGCVPASFSLAAAHYRRSRDADLQSRCRSSGKRLRNRRIGVDAVGRGRRIAGALEGMLKGEAILLLEINLFLGHHAGLRVHLGGQCD